MKSDTLKLVIAIIFFAFGGSAFFMGLYIYVSFTEFYLAGFTILLFGILAIVLGILICMGRKSYWKV